MPLLPSVRPQRQAATVQCEGGSPYFLFASNHMTKPTISYRGSCTWGRSTGGICIDGRVEIFTDGGNLYKWGLGRAVLWRESVLIGGDLEFGLGTELIFCVLWLLTCVFCVLLT